LTLGTTFFILQTVKTILQKVYQIQRVFSLEKISLIPLVGIIHFTDSGGAFGLEELVSSTGPRPIVFDDCDAGSGAVTGKRGMASGTGP